ncbi:unnamed protein product, partial [Fusarium graminearum]
PRPNPPRAPTPHFNPPTHLLLYFDSHRYQKKTTTLSTPSTLPIPFTKAKMSDNSATIPQDPTQAQDQTMAENKGKGKALAEQVTEDTAMDEDEDDDESDEEEEVAEADEDGLEEIDLNNIVEGRRTRGAQIDFAKAAEQHPAEDEDEEDDEDFQPAEDRDTKMSD